MKGDRCEWGEQTRQGKLLQCKNKSTKEVHLENEVAYFCNYHASIVETMLRKKIQHEKLLQELHKEEANVAELVRRLRQLWREKELNEE